MTQGRKALRSLRMARESTNGVRVTPRYLWRGEVDTITDEREVVNPPEQIGIFGGGDRTYIPRLAASLSIPEAAASYEQLSDLLLMAGLGTFHGAGGPRGTTVSANGSSVAFFLNIPTDTAPPTFSYTVETGDNVESMYMPYTIASEVKFAFAGGDAVKVSATLMGRFGTRTNASGSFSAVGTLVQVETVLAAGTFYLDPGVAGATYGAGAVAAGNVLGGEVTISAMWEPKHAVDAGVTYFHTAVLTDHEITGNLILEHQVSGTYGAAGSAGQIEKWRNQDPQLLRMRWPGGTITDGTVGFVNKLFQIDLPIKWQTFGPLDDQNGNDIVTGEFFSKFNELVPSAGRGTIVIHRRGTAEMG